MELVSVTVLLAPVCVFWFCYSVYTLESQSLIGGNKLDLSCNPKSNCDTLWCSGDGKDEERQVTVTGTFSFQSLFSAFFGTPI